MTAREKPWLWMQSKVGVWGTQINGLGVEAFIDRTDGVKRYVWRVWRGSKRLTGGSAKTLATAKRRSEAATLALTEKAP